MNVRATQNFGAVTALYATGEIAGYEKLVAQATAAATAVQTLRGTANDQWGDLMEKCELAAAAADRRLGGLDSFVYEIAACEFVDLANYGVDDTYRLETPNPPAAAALYLTGTRAAYDPLAVSARIVYKELCAVGRSALICADAYRYASPPVADAYYELAGRIAAELGDYTYGATPLEAVRTELENVRTLLAQS